MTKTVVVRFRIKPGMEQEYEKFGASVARVVEANEPGNLMYRVHRTEDPQVFVAVERYRDQAAIDAHVNSQHVKAIMPRLQEMLDGEPEVAMYEEVEI